LEKFYLSRRVVISN